MSSYGVNIAYYIKGMFIMVRKRIFDVPVETIVAVYLSLIFSIFSLVVFQYQNILIAEVMDPYTIALVSFIGIILPGVAFCIWGLIEPHEREGDREMRMKIYSICLLILTGCFWMLFFS